MTSGSRILASEPKLAPSAKPASWMTSVAFASPARHRSFTSRPTEGRLGSTRPKRSSYIRPIEVPEATDSRWPERPQAQGLAREAAALLRAAFRLSAEWNRLDVHPTAAKTVDPEGLTYRHIPYEAHGEARMLYAYGILVQKYLQTHGAQGRKQGCPQRGQPCAGKDQAVVFATFSTKRWRMAATCALVALPVGRRRPSEPLTSFSATAQLSGALA